MLVSLAILLQMNGLTVLLGCASLLLVFPYPLMKRITYWPQAWLGLTFNWGALIGWTAATGFLGWPALLLYLGGIAWTLGYDTIRSEEHTSELQSLMRISYAVFCLKKKKTPKTCNTI